jgi:hypothetical protein
MRLIGLAVVLSLVLAPLDGQAQAGKVYRIGYLDQGSSAARLDLRHVGALQEVPEDRYELRLLLRRQRLPMPGEHVPRDLIEVKYLPGDPPDLPRPVGHGSAVGVAVLDDAQDADDRRFDGASRGPTADEATAASATSSHATEIAIPIQPGPTASPCSRA